MTMRGLSRRSRRTVVLEGGLERGLADDIEWLYDELQSFALRGLEEEKVY
jgi:hypothetical protein